MRRAAAIAVNGLIPKGWHSAEPWLSHLFQLSIHLDVLDACVIAAAEGLDDNYRSHMAMIRLDLDTTFPTLHLVGRNGMHKYNNQDHAMMTAMLAARNILAGERRYDVWNVNEDAEYHEAGMAGVEEALASERLVPQKIGEAETAVA